MYHHSESRQTHPNAPGESRWGTASAWWIKFLNVVSAVQRRRINTLNSPAGSRRWRSISVLESMFNVKAQRSDAGCRRARIGGGSGQQGSTLPAPVNHIPRAGCESAGNAPGALLSPAPSFGATKSKSEERWEGRERVWRCAFRASAHFPFSSTRCPRTHVSRQLPSQLRPHVNYVIY